MLPQHMATGMRYMSGRPYLALGLSENRTPSPASRVWPSPRHMLPAIIFMMRLDAVSSTSGLVSPVLPLALPPRRKI